MLRVIGLLVLITLLGAGYSLAYSTAKIEIAGDLLEIPNKYIEGGREPSFFNNIDDGGPKAHISFDGEELRQKIKGYKFFQDTGNNFPSIFSVLIYEVGDVGRYASEYYDDVAYLKGDFSNALITKELTSSYYRVAPNVHGAARWIYFYKDPRTVDSKHEKLDLIVAECNSILPSKNLAQCTLSVERNGMFLQINLSEINVGLSDKLIEFVADKISQWKQI